MSTALPPRSAGSVEHSIGALTRLESKSLWRSGAPAAVRDAWRRDDHAAAWKAWAQHLDGREDDVAGRIGKKALPIVWGLPEGMAEALVEWVAEGPDAKGQAAVTAAQRWVADCSGREADLVFALECVAWAQRLPRLAPKLGADAWWSLTEALVGIAQEAAAAAPTNAGDDEPAAVEHAEPEVVDQLLAGELPLTLARLLPELRPAADLAEPARKALSAGLDRLTDGEGMVPACLLIETPQAAAPLLLACWTRCLLLPGGSKPWDSTAQGHYEWHVRQTLRIVDRHGRYAFATEPTAGIGDLLGHALRRGGDPSDHAAAAERLKGFDGDLSYETPEPSSHTEWGEWSVLAAGWRDKAPRIVVAHPSDAMQLEVHAGRRVLLTGAWDVAATVNGEAAHPSDDWECQCWHTDEDADYLELTLPLSGGARLERQFFISREDGVGFIAETLFSGRQEPALLELTARLGFGSGVELRLEKETREATLVAGDDPVAGLVPISLAEWREEHRGGELASKEGRLVLTRQATGLNLASFLWIDFSASRFAKQRTWRQLTVAESLKRVTDDVAIGYRVQAAKEQWFIYRSLARRANRTLMGQNLSSEMLVGKYNAPEGTVSEYFEVQGPEDE